MGRHTLATMVQLDKDNEEAAHKVAMQVAAMKPVALDEASVPQAVKDEELKVAIQKTKEEQVEKAVVAAIKKAGINPNLVDSDDHIESNMKKGWLTQEEADKAREIKQTVGAEKAANLNEQMIQNIAKGRVGPHVHIATCGDANLRGIATTQHRSVLQEDRLQFVEVVEWCP